MLKLSTIALLLIILSCSTSKVGLYYDMPKPFPLGKMQKLLNIGIEPFIDKRCDTTLDELFIRNPLHIMRKVTQQEINCLPQVGLALKTKNFALDDTIKAQQTPIDLFLILTIFDLSYDLCSNRDHSDNIAGASGIGVAMGTGIGLLILDSDSTIVCGVVKLKYCILDQDHDTLFTSDTLNDTTQIKVPLLQFNSDKAKSKAISASYKHIVTKHLLTDLYPIISTATLNAEHPARSDQIVKKQFPSIRDSIRSFLSKAPELFDSKGSADLRLELLASGHMKHINTNANQDTSLIRAFDRTLSTFKFDSTPDHTASLEISFEAKKAGESLVIDSTFKTQIISPARSTESIMLVIAQQLKGIRHAYNRILRDQSRVQGTVTARFTINEAGRVISHQIVSSTVSCQELDSAVVQLIDTWQFEQIYRPKDVTEIIYPFTFSH